MPVPTRLPSDLSDNAKTAYRRATCDGNTLQGLRETQTRCPEPPRSPQPDSAQVRSGTATDFEHDQSILADIKIINPLATRVDGRGTVLLGTLGSARLYPHSVGPLTVSDQDTPSGTCQGEECGRGPHPFAPFQPPEYDVYAQYAGRTIRVTTVPMTVVNENGNRTDRPTTEDEI